MEATSSTDLTVKYCLTLTWNRLGTRTCRKLNRFFFNSFLLFQCLIKILFLKSLNISQKQAQHLQIAMLKMDCNICPTNHFFLCCNWSPGILLLCLRYDAAEQRYFVYFAFSLLKVCGRNKHEGCKLQAENTAVALIFKGRCTISPLGQNT